MTNPDPISSAIDQITIAGQDAAASLRTIARSEAIKAFLDADSPLRTALHGAALRYIGGEALDECLQLAARTNADGYTVSIDYLGESAPDREIAIAAADEFQRVVQGIAARGIRGSVSFDLSHLGLLLDPELAFELTSRLATAAAGSGIELMISAEGSERTDDILETYQRLSAASPNVGITIQAYLHRSPDDLADVLQSRGRIRIVKGAFWEPETAALSRGGALNARFEALVAQVIRAGRPLSIATHDPELQDRLRDVLTAGQPDVELEMLFGVQTERLRAMQDLGVPTRLYLPYGREWFLYLTHRLAEHPPNIYRAISDAIAHGRPGTPAS